MSPQRAQRRATWTLLVGAAGIAALVLSVWLVGAKAKADLGSAEASARAHLIGQLRAGCGRGVARDFEAWATNADLAGLARDAARTRHGQPVIARRYRRRAVDAEQRMAMIRLRLPASQDVVTVERFCAALYPDPAP